VSVVAVIVEEAFWRAFFLERKSDGGGVKRIAMENW
jgi:hypothetical protein